MESFEEFIEISNSGEMLAYITYEVKSIKIMDEVYTDADYTSDELIEMLQNNYPFKLTLGVDQSEIDIGAKASFRVGLDWPYESGNDELDTYWGKKSYSYKQDYPGEKQIEIIVKLTASQKRPQN